MALWRIRVIVPDGPGGRQALERALAQITSTHVLAAHLPGAGASTGDVVVDLHEEASLGDLLRTLHEISPQVFVSHVPSDESPVTAGKMRVRRLSRMLSVAG